MISAAMDGSASDGSSGSSAISADGRYVAFSSTATTLVPNPFSGFIDIYVRDTCLGAPAGCTPSTIRASVHTNGTLANGNSRRPAISDDGRFVAFDSRASNLVPNDTNGAFGGNNNALSDVFVRDTCLGAPAGCTPSTIRVSVADDGTEANAGNSTPSISADGRFVTLNTGATNLVAGDTNFGGVILRDTCVGAPAGCTPSTVRASVHSDGTQDGSGSGLGTISANSRFVTFLSYATNVVSDDTNSQPDAFVRDTCLGVPPGCTPGTTRVSVATDGTQGNDRTDNSSAPSISTEGRFVAFTSFATNLVPDDTNDLADVFLRDTCVNTPSDCLPSTTRVSVAFDGAQGDDPSHAPTISDDGRLVVFASLAGNLVPGGTRRGGGHVILRDTCHDAPGRCIQKTILLSKTLDNQLEDGNSDLPTLSANGCFVVFRSNSTNLVPDRSNGLHQIFLARTGFCN